MSLSEVSNNQLAVDKLVILQTQNVFVSGLGII